MDYQPLISVIVPIYNVEAYLDACVSSILVQTYSNLEIWLIDDGSTDGSGSICDAFATADKRVRVVHKPNGGAGSARNHGLDVCQGEGIAMIDADDVIAPEMIFSLYALTDAKTDLVECSFSTESLDPLVQNANVTVRNVDASAALRMHMRDEGFFQMPGTKLYRKTVIEKLRYPQDVAFEDEFFTYRVIGNCRRLVCTSAVLYFYRQREGSAMHAPFRASRVDGLLALQQRLEYVKNNFPELTYDARVSLLLLCMYTMDGTLAYLQGGERRYVRKKIYAVLSELRPIFPKWDNGLRRNLWVILFQLWPEGTSRLRNTARRLLCKS